MSQGPSDLTKPPPSDLVAPDGRALAIPWRSWFQGLMYQRVVVCTTATRPATPTRGQMVVDATLNAPKGKPIWFAADGTGWIDATGAAV